MILKLKNNLTCDGFHPVNVPRVLIDVDVVNVKFDKSFNPNELFPVKPIKIEFNADISESDILFDDE